jgi:hypothetical protein
MKTALCLICHRPNDIWLKFLNKFVNYDVYVLIDDNTKTYSTEFKNLNVIQVQNEDCKESGFCDVNFFMDKHIFIAGWDKALYYFAVKNTNYKNIWFIEDDVFFANETTLVNIDNQYPVADLLANTITSKTENPTWPHWKLIENKINEPHYTAMCCASRVSNCLLQKIKEYATTNKTLFFIEGLIPTLCRQNYLTSYSPSELNTIYWRHSFLISTINTTQVYHPIKSIRTQLAIRNLRCLPLQGVLMK